MTNSTGQADTKCTVRLSDREMDDLAYVLRDALGDSLCEGTPTGDLKRAVITILREAGFVVV